jgi:hypothetical protein
MDTLQKLFDRAIERVIYSKAASIMARSAAAKGVVLHRVAEGSVSEGNCRETTIRLRSWKF